MRRWKTILTGAAGLLGRYLEDILMVAGSACLIAAAGLRWGVPAGLAAAGAILIVLSILVARSGRR